MALIGMGAMPAGTGLEWEKKHGNGTMKVFSCKTLADLIIQQQYSQAVI